MEISQEGKAQAAGRSGTGSLAVVLALISLSDSRKGTTGVVKAFDVGRRRPFLRPKDGGSPKVPYKGLVTSQATSKVHSFKAGRT